MSSNNIVHKLKLNNLSDYDFIVLLERVLTEYGNNRMNDKEFLGILKDESAETQNLISIFLDTREIQLWHALKT